MANQNDHEASGLTVYRAEHYGRGIVLCTYTTPEPAREHCETELRREHTDGDRLSLDWVPDNEDDPAVWELYAQRGEDEFVTGYCVTVVDVHDTYDPNEES
ncbi:hypothetical protein [Streptomyces sp. DH37]|uniref:hypothetical protein n=1 Tax=Streptomyces sp. DH37 TaxID=3040122 RepID=UPI0024431E97|nr:hypothetical protein [Streptomyces sp. DH37]MDG9703751.1 hypothetical protein [Streptomyces sp. DH37]